MIEFQSASKVFPPSQAALAKVDFRIEQGEFVFVAGASGAGKSTLLKLLIAAEFPTNGSVKIAKRDSTLLTGLKRDAFRRSTGIVFQDYKLLPAYTAEENVALRLEAQGIDHERAIRRSREMLEFVDLTDRCGAFPPTLSGGEQQRVAVARALAAPADLLVADEPTGNLDPEMSRQVFELLIEANQAGATVIVATHNLALVEELGKRTIVLDRGKVIGDFPGRS